MAFEFKVLACQKGARAGIFKTPHGVIETPAFIPVGTQGTVKSLTPEDLSKIGVQIILANTYHLYLRPGVGVIEKLGGLHKFMGWNGPLMTDSGGFQIFSLAREKFQISNFTFRQKTCSKQAFQIEEKSPVLVKIDDDGVTFRSHLDGSLHRFTPEKSIEIQKRLRADIILAFDECPPYGVSKEKVKKAMERTHHWALRSLKVAGETLSSGAGSDRFSNASVPAPRKAGLGIRPAPYGTGSRENLLRVTPRRVSPKQALFGIIQGGVFQDLRVESAKFIANLGFDGLAIGGVAVGESKEEMRQVLDWLIPHLPEEKPRHLLGVGEVDDLFAAVERGIDLFDCVMPTRLGRMGHVLIKKGQTFNSSRSDLKRFTMDITKAIFVDDPRPIEEGCHCFTCQNFSRAYLCHLFRAKELLAYRLATYHNLYFISNLMQKIRRAIINGQFLELKKEWLGLS